MLNEIERYRFKIRVYLTSLGAVAALGFSILQALTGDEIGGFFSFVCAVYFAYVVYLLVKQKRYLWEGRGYAILLSFTLLLVIRSNPEYGIFWAYVWITYIFLLMRLKEALIAAFIFVAFTLYFIDSYYPTNVLIRIYSTLLLVGLFALVFSVLIEQLLTRVDKLISHDPLTKALNRTTFHTSIENALSAYHRYGIPSALFLFDLDNFKKINDTYGHLAGDKVLKRVSKVVRKRLRESDQFFRYGGEEFAILLTNTKQEEALKLAEDIRLLVQKQNYDIQQTVTISGGIAEAAKDDKVNSWIDRCDKALYQAKSESRNKVILKKLSHD